MVPRTDRYFKNESQNFLGILLYFMQMGNHPHPLSQPLPPSILFGLNSIYRHRENLVLHYFGIFLNKEVLMLKGKKERNDYLFLTGFMDAMNPYPYPDTA